MLQTQILKLCNTEDDKAVRKEASTPEIDRDDMNITTPAVAATSTQPVEVAAIGDTSTVIENKDTTEDDKAEKAARKI